MQGPGTFVISALMLASIALAIGGMVLILRRRDVRRGALMLVAAVVFLANVLIWTWPMPEQTPQSAVPPPAAPRG